ncbi:poly(U)-specific endoribonuclease-B [Zea mays]|uniref:poly(U)-specific endoribonuclease-B n=1 Tax=Zea mays TaxID=4577 RepID=UPI0009A9C57E|nr:poly(U)-specific endoribonuclease-B [Zea mays]|eukprot:XP_020397294.1 poly(U)-specific endoribonuclease-B [Zea mays]
MQQRVEEVVPLLVAAKQQQRVEEAVVLVFGPLLPSSTTLCAVADLQVQQQSKRVCETEQLDLLAVALSSTGVARRASKDGCVLQTTNIQGYKEVVTQQDKHEEIAFVDEIARTAPIKYLHRYLVQKGAVPQDYEDFKRMLTSLWFDLYGRGGNSSFSSAFEHVFVGEIKGRGQGESEVSGFHNWIQFYLEEDKENVDYQGYIFPRRRGESPDSEIQLLTVQFEWHGVLKSVSSTLIGVSPEFEVALYTLCFFVGGEDNRVDIGPYSVNVKCYRLGNNKIGSAFPIAEN